jgi:hypothetical protein
MAGARSPDVSAMSATAATTMYAADLAPTRDELADWMRAWLGGPPRYFERPGADCIGAAHGALDGSGAPAALQRRIRRPLAELASALRKR